MMKRKQSDYLNRLRLNIDPRRYRPISLVEEVVEGVYEGASFLRPKERELSRVYRKLTDRIHRITQTTDLSQVDLKEAYAGLRKKFDANLGKLKEEYETVKSLENNILGFAQEGRAAEQNIQQVKRKYLKAREKEIKKFAPEVFALAQEGIRRVYTASEDIGWNISSAYNEQFWTAYALSQPQITEVATGEGKTLSAALAACLQALDGQGVHVVTPNAYLAERDAEEMQLLFDQLGLRVGLIKKSLGIDERRIEYDADVTYGHNQEFAFDFLQDNHANNKLSWRRSRKALAAIVDEADDVLINKGKTPHIVSGEKRNTGAAYSVLNKALTDDEGELLFSVDELSPDDDGTKSLKFEADSEDDASGNLYDSDVVFKPGTIKTILTPNGQKRLELLLSSPTIKSELSELGVSEDSFPNRGDFYSSIGHDIINVLRAHVCLKKDEDYSVVSRPLTAEEEKLIAQRKHVPNVYKTKIINERGKEETVLRVCEVHSIDNFTSRLLVGQRLNDGLHEAIEAKEGLEPLPENIKAEEISLQNYFLTQYDLISGMSGTAVADKEEFREIYGLDVVQIPRHDHQGDSKPLKRFDEASVYGFKLFKDKYDARVAAIEDLVATHEKNQPVLMIADSDDVSDELHDCVKNYLGIDAKLLNAATTYEEEKLEAEVIKHAGKPGSVIIATQIAGRGTDIKLAEFTKLYGLRMIGVGLPDTQSLERQANGRSGRQGDPGSSVWYVGTDDDNIKNFLPYGFDEEFSKKNKCDGTSKDGLIHKLTNNRFTNAVSTAFGKKARIKKFSKTRFGAVYCPRERLDYLVADLGDGEYVQSSEVNKILRGVQNKIQRYAYNERYATWQRDTSKNAFLTQLRSLKRGLINEFEKPEKVDERLIEGYIARVRSLAVRNGTIHVLDDHARVLGISSEDIRNSESLEQAIDMFDWRIKHLWDGLDTSRKRFVLGAAIDNVSQAVTQYVKDVEVFTGSGGSLESGGISSDHRVNLVREHGELRRRLLGDAAKNVFDALLAVSGSLDEKCMGDKTFFKEIGVLTH
ncbi:hypothetical protein COV18_07620 [Candidatus Woesearchaeota archaeon CG10_big_fil_rev_8_21_14_0_10_37_12]|nr:MAG: hypothetical protein COV18_07620 [Candidatus Woesearchaeota archaeon CG10_big_fil_rev_8_21_14_0_10_37_12]